MRFHCSAQFLLAFAVLALTAGTASAATPRFTNLLPHGVQRGTEADVVLYGTNLQDAEEVLLYDSGMEVLSITQPEAENQQGRQITVRFNIAADCPLGTQRMRIRTRTGLSDLKNLHVGALPIVTEVEPNTDFAAPQVIEKNVTVHGRVDNEDVDYYVVDCVQGERLTAEVFGLRLGHSSSGNFFDPYVAILNEQRFEQVASDDTALVRNDAVTSIIVPEDGRYYIQIRDAAYTGDGRAYYLLHIGNFSRPHAVVPAGGRPGETLEVTYYGDVTGPFTRQATLPTEARERFGLEVTDDHGVAPSAQPFRVTDLENIIDQEPNNSADVATQATAPGAFNGLIGEPDDFDMFKFTATQGQVYEIEAYARRIRSPLDSVIYVYRADNGQQLAANDDSRGPDSYLRFTAPHDGEFIVGIRDHLKNGGPAYSYRIELTPVAPRIVTKPIDVSRYVQPKMVVAQGAGFGMVVNVQRQDVGGPVAFRSENLPAGVTIECPEGWRAGGQMPLVFYAADDAPVGGQFSTVTTFLNDPNQPDLAVAGPLSQDILMIRGQNNNYVWTEQQNRVPIAVVERAPFKVWIEPPTVPLVRGGSMQLKVVCEKAEGWDNDIQVLLLQNAPGVSSSRSVKIAAGQTEALIPMNAAGNAAVQETMIAVRCIASVGNGSYETCTPFVPLRVEEQYVTFEFAAAAIHQGGEVPVIVTVTKRKDFEGEAVVTLVGLPANATAEPFMLTKDMEQITFSVNAAENTPVSDNKNLLCQVQIPEAGTTIHHSLGTGRLRIDPPPPEPVEPAPMPEPMPVAETAEPEPQPKPLSRLEQLRQQAEEQRRAAAGGGR